MTHLLAHSRRSSPKVTEATTSPDCLPLELLIAPAWMVDTLTRENCSLDILNNAEKLTALFSMDDLGLYCYVNAMAREWVTEPVVASFHEATVFGQLLNEPSIEAAFQSHVINKRADNLSSLDTRDLLGPLSEPVSPAQIKFWVKSVGTSLVVLRPEDIGQTLNMDKVSMLDDLLYVANMHMSMEGLAKLPLFRLFLNSV